MAEPRRPFTFDQSFDLSAMKAEQEKKAQPTFGEGDLAAARESGYQQGLVEGRAAAQGDINQRQSDFLQRVERLMQRLAEDVWKVYTEQKQTASDIAITIVRKLLPNYVKLHGMQEMTTAIEASVAEMINEPRLVLRVPDVQFDYMSKEINAIAGKLGYGGKIITLADPNLGEHDCRLEWADGGMERNLNYTWSEIERQVLRHSPAQAQAQTHAQTIPPQEGLPSSTTSIAV
jgi:flagellar assembly protein FliH